MTDADLVAARQRMKDFAATDLGRLLVNFESKLARAWQVDTQAGSFNVSDKRLREVWEAADHARAALVEKLMAIQL